MTKKLFLMLIFNSFYALIFSMDESVSQVRMHIHEDKVAQGIGQENAEEQDENLENLNYLPEDCSISALEKINKQKALKILKYLCTFQNNLKKRSPFMESDQLIFDNSLAADQKVQYWFDRGLKLVLFTSIIPFLGLLALNNNITPVQAICIISAASAVVTAVGQYIAFVATGNLPDEASQKANAKQNKFNELKEAYIRLSRTWVDLYFSEKKELAHDIANKMNNALDNLIITIKEKVGYDHADILLCPIKEVMHYIRSNEKLDISPIIANYIEIKEMQLKMELPD